MRHSSLQAQLWRTDGSEAGTFWLGDFRELYGRALATDFGIFFSGDDGVRGAEPWYSDGTLEGTRMVKDVVPGPSGSLPYFLAHADGTAWFQVANGLARELWRTDGSEAGTVRLHNSLGAEIPTPFRDRIVFWAADVSSGSEPWISDGTHHAIS